MPCVQNYSQGEIWRQNFLNQFLEEPCLSSKTGFHIHFNSYSDKALSSALLGMNTMGMGLSKVQDEFNVMKLSPSILGHIFSCSHIPQILVANQSAILLASLSLRKLVHAQTIRISVPRCCYVIYTLDNKNSNLRLKFKKKASVLQ